MICRDKYRRHHQQHFSGLNILLVSTAGRCFYYEQCVESCAKSYLAFSYPTLVTLIPLLAGAIITFEKEKTSDLSFLQRLSRVGFKNVALAPMQRAHERVQKDGFLASVKRL